MIKAASVNKRIDELPPLPTIVDRIRSVTSAPNTSATHVAKVLRGDPAVAARVLRVANSSFYGARGQVTQVSRAVVILGGQAISNLVTGMCARSALIPTTGHTELYNNLWVHSVATAALCDRIARQVGFEPAEEAFLAGLLHDVGKLAIASCDPDYFQELLDQHLCEARRLELECEHYGMNHADAGSEILRRWGLPNTFSELTRLHHDPDSHYDSDIGKLLAIVAVSNELIKMAGLGSDLPTAPYARVASAAQQLDGGRDPFIHLGMALDSDVSGVIESLAGPGTGRRAWIGRGKIEQVLWIRPGDIPESVAGRRLLEAHNVSVRYSTADDFAVDINKDELVLVDSSYAETETQARIISTLKMIGHQRVAFLQTDSDGPLRGYDVNKEVHLLPQVFTAFDLKWLESQW